MSERGIVKVNRASPLATVSEGWSQAQVDLIKRTVANGTTDDELALFLYTAKKRGLDPLCKQVHAVMRNTKGGDGQYRKVMTIQTGIDGYRAIAERTGQYAGGYRKDITEGEGHPVEVVWAVRKVVQGQTFEVEGRARWEEYAQTYFDKKSRQQVLSPMWRKMPYTMLEKCAEAKALRIAFPEHFAGLYTHEEMGQADNDEPSPFVAAQLEQPPEDAEVIEAECVDVSNSSAPAITEVTPFAPGTDTINKGQIGEYVRALNKAYPDKETQEKAHAWFKEKFGGKSRTKWTSAEWEWAMAQLSKKGGE